MFNDPSAGFPSSQPVNPDVDDGSGSGGGATLRPGVGPGLVSHPVNPSVDDGSGSGGGATLRPGVGPGLVSHPVNPSVEDGSGSGVGATLRPGVGPGLISETTEDEDSTGTDNVGPVTATDDGTSDEFSTELTVADGFVIVETYDEDGAQIDAVDTPDSTKPDGKPAGSKPNSIFDEKTSPETISNPPNNSTTSNTNKGKVPTGGDNSGTTEEGTGGEIVPAGNRKPKGWVTFGTIRTRLSAPSVNEIPQRGDINSSIAPKEPGDDPLGDLLVGMLKKRDHPGFHSVVTDTVDKLFADIQNGDLSLGDRVTSAKKLYDILKRIWKFLDFAFNPKDKSQVTFLKDTIKAWADFIWNFLQYAASMTDGDLAGLNLGSVSGLLALKFLIDTYIQNAQGTGLAVFDASYTGSKLYDIIDDNLRSRNLDLVQQINSNVAPLTYDDVASGFMTALDGVALTISAAFDSARDDSGNQDLSQQEMARIVISKYNQGLQSRGGSIEVFHQHLTLY